MSGCDKDTGKNMPGVLENAGVSLSSRKYLFYFVCTPIRLSLVVLALMYHESPIFRAAALVAAILAVYTNASKLMSGDEAWWSRRIHLVTSVLVAVSVTTSMTGSVPCLLVADIAFGLVSSFANAPW